MRFRVELAPGPTNHRSGPLYEIIDGNAIASNNVVCSAYGRAKAQGVADALEEQSRICTHDDVALAMGLPAQGVHNSM